eukprot:1396139-Rhodomonas_salina.3
MQDTWPALNQVVERMDMQTEFQYQLDNQEFNCQLEEQYRMPLPVIATGQKDQHHLDFEDSQEQLLQEYEAEQAAFAAILSNGMGSSPDEAAWDLIDLSHLTPQQPESMAVVAADSGQQAERAVLGNSLAALAAADADQGFGYSSAAPAAAAAGSAALAHDPCDQSAAPLTSCTAGLDYGSAAGRD